MLAYMLYLMIKVLMICLLTTSLVLNSWAQEVTKALLLATHDGNSTGPRGYKTFLGLTQQSMKFVLLTNVKFLATENSLLLNIAEHKSFSANKYKHAKYCWHFHYY